MVKILIIAPHPDDEIIGCGGLIAKLSKKHKVSVCYVTCPYTPEWSQEYIDEKIKQIYGAKEILNIDKLYFLDFPAAKLDTIPMKDLNSKILEIIKIVNPDILFIPHIGDLHVDHRLVFESCIVASRPINNIKSILSYEVLSETEWGYENHFVPNSYIDITDTIDIKLNAMKEISLETKQPPHPRSLEVIEALAKKRGSEVGFKYAESFKVIREKIDL